MIMVPGMVVSWSSGGCTERKMSHSDASLDAEIWAVGQSLKVGKVFISNFKPFMARRFYNEIPSERNVILNFCNTVE